MNDSKDESSWQVAESTYVVKDSWLKVRSDTLLTPEGKTITPWYVLEYPEWVNCLVIDHRTTLFC